jgi:hypothetical protein
MGAYRSLWIQPKDSKYSAEIIFRLGKDFQQDYFLGEKLENNLEDNFPLFSVPGAVNSDNNNLNFDYCLIIIENNILSRIVPISEDIYNQIEGIF